MSVIDFLGSLLSLLCTYLFIKEDKRAWLISAVAIPFDAFVYYQSHLYGDMFLQGIYLSMTLYGYKQWRNDSNPNQELPISYTNQLEKLLLLCIATLSIFALNPVLKPFNQPHIATLDSITTVLSLCAQWLLCKKKIETWLVWFIVDGLYAYLYIIKSLPFHGLMAFIYLLMAISGWRNWHRHYLLTPPCIQHKND